MPEPTMEGRELDVAVARAIGWTNLAVSDWDHDAVDPLDWGGVPPGGGCIRRVPRFSTSWEWAGRALERMPQGWHVVRVLDIDLGECFEACSDYLEAPYGENCIRARAKTGPEAIARAVAAVEPCDHQAPQQPEADRRTKAAGEERDND